MRTIPVEQVVQRAFPILTTADFY